MNTYAIYFINDNGHKVFVAWLRNVNNEWTAEAYAHKHYGTDHKVMDGINAARVLFPKMWFDEGCSDGLEALRQYRTEFDEKKKTFKDNPLHDWTSHAADAFRYMAQAYRDMTPDPKPKPARPKGIMDATFDQLMGMQRPREEFI